MPIQKGLSSYDTLSKKRDALLKEVDKLDRQIRKLETDKRSLENKNKLYPNYLELIKIDSELSQLEDMGCFSKDALETLKEMKMRVSALEKQIDEEYKDELNVLTLKNDGLVFNEDLIKQESTINSLQRLSGKYRSDLDELILTQTERGKLARRIQAEIEKMGDEWSERLIADFKFTHFQKDEIQTFKERFDRAKSKKESIKNKLEHHREMKAEKSSRYFMGPTIYRYAFYTFTLIGAIGMFVGLIGKLVAQSHVQWSIVIFAGIV